MFRIKKILVPIDFSDCAKIALPVAVEFATTFGAEIVLMHVIPPSTYPVANVMRMRHFPDIQEEVHRRCKEELDAIQESIGPSVRCSQRLVEGIPAAEVVDTAAEEAIDLIIVSTHGHTGIKHALLGSTTEKIVRLAPCPVLTVKAIGSRSESEPKS